MKAKGFDWDRGNWPKCGKHGLSKAEIEYVLTNQPMVLPDRYPVDIEARFNAVGKNQEGRYIFVVFTRVWTQLPMRAVPQPKSVRTRKK